jgi:DNA adenine methylase
LDLPLNSPTKRNTNETRPRLDSRPQFHRKLAAVLNELKGAVILSGYECPLYDELYAGWRRAQREALADGALKRTEVLWMRNVAQETTLWNQIPA